MPTAPELIEAAFVAAVNGITGTPFASSSVLDHEPRDLPKRPCLTMLWRGGDPIDAETGNAQDVNHEWTVYVYLDLKDFKKAQLQAKQIVPLLRRAVGINPTLGLVCDIAILHDDLQEPELDREQGLYVKRLRFTARLSEA